MAKTTEKKERVTQDDSLLGLVIDKFTFSDQQRKSYEDKWDKLYDLYRFQPKRPASGKANLFIPYAFSNVETVFPRMVAKTPRIDVVPAGVQDVEGSSIMKSLIEYTWDKYNVDETIRRTVKSMLIYGTGVAKVVWKKEIKQYKTLENDILPDGTVDSKEVSKSKTTYDGPCVLNLELRDIYPDPDGVDVDSCRYIIHKYKATKSELEGNPNYPKNLLKRVVFGFTNDQIRRGLNKTDKSTSVTPNEAEVLEYWEDDRLIVIAGGVILRDEPNPYDHKRKPFVFISDHIDDQVIYGIGEVEPIESLQAEMNTLRNQRMDFNNITLNPVWQVRAGAVSDIDSIQFKPNYKIIVNGDTNGIKPIDMPQAPQTSFREEDSIKLDLQTVTGVSDYSKGNEGGNLNNTATGISLIQEAANQRFNAKLQNLEFGLKTVGELIRDLWLQFASPEMIIRITEKDGYSFLQVKKEDIQGQYDIKIESGSTVPSNKLQERTEEMNKYNVLSANPLIQQSPEALMEVTRSLLEKWHDPNMNPILEALQKQIDEITRQKEEQEAMQRDAMLKQQAMEQAQGIASKARGRAAGMMAEGSTPQGMPEEYDMSEDERLQFQEQMAGDAVPPEYEEMAAAMLQKGQGPIENPMAEEAIGDLANSIR